MTEGIWILGDQLNPRQAALASCTDRKQQTPVLFVESLAHVRQRPYHRQKLVLVWSAMRHFAQELEQQGWQVTYYQAAEDFATPLQNWMQTHGVTDLKLMQPSDRPFTRMVQGMVQEMDPPGRLHLLPNNLFLWTVPEFEDWAKGRKRMVMEDFYREGRKRFEVLMDGDEPEGGTWNLDKENRKPPKGKLEPPAPKGFVPDAITQAVMQQVEGLDMPLFGEVTDFAWAVSREQALEVLADFVRNRLPTFGPYQDAMVTGEDTMWHALLSPYLNLGLLHPLEVIQAVEQAYRGEAKAYLPLNSVEGFIRQVLGWREYMRGLYYAVEEEYFQRNWFEHQQPLPEFFWSGDTDMNCLHQVLTGLQRTGYAHHIQRLMVLSNFALIAGISPQEVENWFHATFIDAYDWVMQTNVLGMGVFADGGLLATKPYAASANYIHKMSDYCKNCSRDRKQRVGENACPFNTLYWDFLHRHRDKLKSQGRMNLILANLDKIPPEELEAIHQTAEALLEGWKP